MLEFGQSTHIFDHDKLGSNEIHVRRAVKVTLLLLSTKININ